MDIVLGAGIVGTATALQLRLAGREVVLVDRQMPGLATSFGNAGLLEQSDLVPIAFPHDLRELLSYASGRNPRAAFDAFYLPQLAPFLFRYWRNSAPERMKSLPGMLAPLLLNSITAHKALMAEAGATQLLRPDGWLQLHRSGPPSAETLRNIEVSRDHGQNVDILDSDEIAARVPQLRRSIASAVHWRDSASISDPGELTRLYAARFSALGGTFVNAAALAAEATDSGWSVSTDRETVTGQTLIVALGPWSKDFVRRFGYRLPLAVKRGYHMHFAVPDAERPSLPVVDSEAGIVLTPMTRGVRMTTAIEFAPIDASLNFRQIEQGERAGRELLALGERLDTPPWHGARPCTPDMRPVIGPAPRHENLWFAFGHAHHGLTLSAITGKLIAEALTSGKPSPDLAPFSPTRFG